MHLISAISAFAIPIILFIIISFGLVKRVGVYDCFMEGANEGLITVFRIIPPIVGILCAVAMMRESGLLNILTSFMSPVTRIIGMPDELLPLALLKPVSGGGSIAILTDIINKYGADSFIGRAASIMMGSTETTFYTLAVYFGAAKVYRTRHALPAALVTDIVGIVSSVIICRLLLGG